MAEDRDAELSFAARLVDFGRSLRASGLPIDSNRLALAQRSLLITELTSRAAVRDALAVCLLSRIEDEAVFLAQFDAFFGFQDLASPVQSLVPPAPEPAGSDGITMAPASLESIAPDAKDDAITEGSSAVFELRHADFATLSEAERDALIALAQQTQFVIPNQRIRRRHPSDAGPRLDWREIIRRSQGTQGEPLDLARIDRQRKPARLIVLLDTSGSMAAYARTTLACLHPMLRGCDAHVFAVGNRVSELTHAFKCRNTDAMLQRAGQAIEDYATGTRLADCLRSLRLAHTALWQGRRPWVILISDGLDTGGASDFANEVRKISASAHRFVWVNPLMRYAGYQPIARGPHVLALNADEMVAGHNLASIAGLGELLRRQVFTSRFQTQPVSDYPRVF